MPIRYIIVAVLFVILGFGWMQARLQIKNKEIEINQITALNANKLIKLQEQTIIEQGNLENAKKKIREKDQLIASLRTSSNGLRDKLRDYSSTSTIACETRTRNLSDLAAKGTELLDRGSGLLRQCAKDHDDRLKELETIIKIWEQK